MILDGAKYLVSFCNGGRARLAVIGENGIEREIDLDLPAEGGHVVGLTGIAFHQSRCVVGVQCSQASLAVLDRTWKVEAVHPLDDVADLHGIASHGDEIVVVSAGTNQVMAFDPRSRALRLLWAGQESLSDSMHLNDVTAQGRTLLCSRFGIRAPDAMRSGDVFDVMSGDRLVTHLREPHSVVATIDDIFILESPTGDLLRLRKGFAPRRICGIQGYARGLAVTATHFAIGKSGYRGNSRHHLGDWRLAPLTHSGTAAEELGESGVYIVERSTLESRFINTTAVGLEIYQIAALPEDFIRSATVSAGGMEMRTVPLSLD